MPRFTYGLRSSTILAALVNAALLLVIATGATAAVAVTFASYAVPLLGLSRAATSLSRRPMA